MKLLVPLLATTTLLFGWSTVHFAGALHEEKSRTAEIVATTTTSRPATEGTTGLRSWGRNTVSPGTGRVPIAAKTADPRDADQLALTRYRLSQLQTPAGRTERADAIRKLIRKDYLALARSIQFEDGEGLVELVTGQTLQRMQLRYECELDANCDLQKFQQEHRLDQNKALEKALGPEMFVRYTKLSEATLEQAYAFELRLRLPAARRLSDAEMAQLAVALHEERLAFIDSARSRGEETDELHSYIISAAVPGSPDETAQRVSSAADYNERLRRRAAALLTRDQLAAFEMLQTETLAGFREQLQDEEIKSAARKAAGG